MPWPSRARPQPLPSWQSLRMPLGELSPRMEPFPGVAMEIQQAHPLLRSLQGSPRTGDRWGRADSGTFSCGRAKRKFWSGGWQQVAEARCPGRSSSGCRHHQGTLGWKQQAMFPTHTPPCLHGLGILRPLTPTGRPAEVLWGPYRSRARGSSPAGTLLLQAWCPNHEKTPNPAVPGLLPPKNKTSPVTPR